MHGFLVGVGAVLGFVICVGVVLVFSKCCLGERIIGVLGVVAAVGAGVSLASINHDERFNVAASIARFAGEPVCADPAFWTREADRVLTCRGYTVIFNQRGEAFVTVQPWAAARRRN